MEELKVQLQLRSYELARQTVRGLMMEHHIPLTDEGELFAVNRLADGIRAVAGHLDRSYGLMAFEQPYSDN